MLHTRRKLNVALAALALLLLTAPDTEAAQNRLNVMLGAEAIEILQATRQQVVIVQPFNGTPTAVAWVVLNYAALRQETKIVWDADAYSIYEARAVPQVGVVMMPESSMTAGTGGTFSYNGTTLIKTESATNHAFSVTNDTSKAGTFGLSLPYYVNNVSPGNVPMQASVVFGHGSASITAPKSISIFTTSGSVRAGQVMDEPPTISITLDYSTPGTTHTITFNSQTREFQVSQ